MDDPIHLGSYPPFPNPDSITYTRRIGYLVEKSTLVLNTQVVDFITQLEIEQKSFHTEPHIGTPYTLVSWTERDDTGITGDTWELVGNELEKDIWELPKIRNEMTKLINAPGTTQSPENSGNLFYQWHAFLQRVVNGKVAGEEEVPEWHRESDESIRKVKIFTDAEFEGAIVFVNSEAGLPLPGQAGSLDAILWKELAAAISRGVTSFPLSSFVVRHTQVLPPLWNVAIPVQLANLIFTKDTLVNYFAGTPNPIPPEFVQSMPPGYYQYKTPTYTSQRDGSWFLHEEWYWATEFDHFIYDNYIYIGT
jgi:hypothetical protein